MSKLKPKKRRSPRVKARPEGRPSKFEQSFVDQARRLAMLGQTDIEMAAFFGVAESTIYLWKQKHAEFSEAIKEGKEKADSMVADGLFKRALGYSHPAVKIMQHEGAPVIVPYTEHYAPDTAACIFWLKNRQPAKWRDKVATEISGPEGGPVQAEVKHACADSMAALAAKIEKLKAGG